MLWLALLHTAFAGGYYYSESGVIGTGRGGAWVAGANTQFAQLYNPAGLIRIDAPTVNLGWSGVSQEIAFTRLGSDGAFFDEVTNAAPPYSVPELGFATPLAHDTRVGDFALAVGFTSPFAPSSLYPADGPQRYSVYDTSIYQFQVGPSLAWRPVPQVTVGASLQWEYFEVGEALKATTSGLDDPGGDVAVDLGVKDPFTLGWNAGLLLDPVPAVSVGFSVQPPTTFRARGAASLDFDGNALGTLFDETYYEDDDIALTLSLPWVLRGGVAVRPIPKVEVEAALVWQDWSSLGDIEVTDVDIRIAATNPLVPEDQKDVPDTFVLPAGLNDTFSWRLGAEWRALDALAVRTGGFTENGSVPEQELSVALVDPAKTQWGGGASVFLLRERLRFDGSFAWIWFQRQEIRDSTVSQLNVGGFNTNAVVVGNGDLSSHGWIVGGEASWAFRPREGAR